MIAALCTFLAVFVAPSLTQEFEDPMLISPCPDVFQYISPPAYERGRRWDGLIVFPTDTNRNNSLHIVIELDNEAWFLGNYLGDVATYIDEHFIIQNDDFYPYGNEKQRTMNIIVLYNPLKKAPELAAIKLNSEYICIREIEKNTDFSDSPGSAILSQLSVGFAIAKGPKSTNPEDPNGQPQCGKVVPNPLALNSTRALETQWPWQVALYQTQNSQHKYICGGTLITARHTITAAHCVTMRSSPRVLDRHTLAVFLGEHNLWTRFEGMEVRYVKDISVSQDYNVFSYRHDLAILQLDQPLKYTDWIRPACLWPSEETDLNAVIGKKGLMLSWDFDDKGDVISDLSQEEMPVVSRATCIGSYSQYTNLTSEYTYCAGNRQEKSSCPSAGSGMVFRNGSSWYLRGLLSFSAPRQDRCDTTHYAVFTDLAKFLPWIHKHIWDF